MKATYVFPILVVILAIENALADKTIRVPFRIIDRNTTSRFARRQFGKAIVPTRSAKEQAWIGPCEIGTPPKSFDMLYDTGSYSTWVSDLTCQNCGDLPRYDGGQSTTFQDLKTPFLAKFGNTPAKGTWTQDVFSLGRNVAFQLPFGRANFIPDFPKEISVSGVVGLRFGKSPQPNPAMLEVISKLPLLDENVISCRFDKNTNTGELLFGGVEPQYVDGDIEYTQVVTDDWIIPIAYVQIRDRTLAKGKFALVDTGSTFIRLSHHVVEAFYKDSGAKLMDDGFWAVPSPFPYAITVWIGQGKYNVPADDIPLKQAPKYGDMYLGAVQPSNYPDMWFLGNPFIKDQYMVFDFGKQAIGIGKRRAMSSDGTD